MIRFEHVFRHYGDPDSPALEDISVEFNRGDFVFLIGASGSGKSTLLRMILRESLPQRGRVTVAGQNLGLMLERRVPEYRRSIGMVFQDFRLLPDKTVYENVAFAMRVIGSSRSTIRKRVMDILAKVELDPLAKRYPHEISGGEQQRAAIARAIVNSPAIVLADEPTGNLDPHASEEVMKILRWINDSGTTVIMATHDRAIVDRMHRRVVQLQEGKLVRDEGHGVYDPAADSQADRLLVQEEEPGGLLDSDPIPSRDDPEIETAGLTVDELELDPGQWQEPLTPATPAGQMRINRLQSAWPEDQIDREDHADAQAHTGDAEADNSGAETDQVEHDQGDEPSTQQMPRPRSSAAQATYADAQRTVEQVRLSKVGLFRRIRRK